MTKDEALRALEDCDGRDILSAATAEAIAAAFHVRPEVYPLTDERFDDAVLLMDRSEDELGIMALSLLRQIARHEGVSIESSYLGRQKRFRELLHRLR